MVASLDWKVCIPKESAAAFVCLPMQTALILQKSTPSTDLANPRTVDALVNTA